MAETLYEHLQNSFNCGCGPCELSDKNCTCNLKLGSDFHFIQEIAKQVSKYYGRKYLQQVFGQTINGQSILAQNEKRTRDSYPDVYKFVTILRYICMILLDKQLQYFQTFIQLPNTYKLKHIVRLMQGREQFLNAISLSKWISILRAHRLRGKDC